MNTKYEDMKKFLIIGILLAIVFAVGIFYRQILLPKTLKTVPETGKTIKIEMRAKENQWRFEPDNIEIQAGDKVILNVFNEDDYDHGLAIEAYGINKRMPPKSWVKIEFTANRLGDFPFYCSVPCGGGEVNGGKRNHYDMIGKIIVK